MMKKFLFCCLLTLSAAEACPAEQRRLEFGIGDRFDQTVNGKELISYRQAEKDGLDFKYYALWLTPGWPKWITKKMIQQVIADGYTPVLAYYTFGDRGGRENLEADNRAAIKAWYKDIEVNLIPLLNVNAEVLVVLEPEFNIIPAGGTSVTEWDEWNDIAGKAIDMIHKGAPRAKVGLCPGDWHNYNLEKCMARAAKKCDFIAFPEMRSASDATADTKSASYRDVADTALAFTEYLKKTFHKPILFAYLALSSYANGDPLGWQDVQAEIISEIFRREREFLDNGVFALLFFSYYDDPTHGTEFFGEAEKYFGLKDAQGNFKKAWNVWQKNTAIPEPVDE
ncbi:MAG: hypothetical protein WCS77_04670 [Elusimicrobiaceae bacterium]